jgi:3-oxoacyl-(acyl-carrier-protein) synthase
MKLTKKIVITQIEATCSLGNNTKEIASNLLNVPQVEYVKDFGFHSLKNEKPCFKVPNFDPESILGKKGLRLKDHATKLLLSTIETGFKDIFEHTEENKRPGICIGTCFGSVQSIGDFLSDAIVNGFHNVNPQLFANTVINSPTSNANIRYISRSLSSTISTTFNSGLDALLYATMFLENGEDDWIIVGGLEELSYYGILGFEKNGLLSLSDNILPFSKEADGTILGEGCGIICLETEEHAKARGAKILAELKGIFSCFDPKKGEYRYNPEGTGARFAIKKACEKAEISTKDISLIVSCANGIYDGDFMEAKVIYDLFGEKPVASYKIKTGECIGASFFLNLICALLDAKEKRISGANNKYSLMLPINFVSESIKNVFSEYILLNSFSCDGYCGSVVIKNLS